LFSKASGGNIITLSPGDLEFKSLKQAAKYLIQTQNPEAYIKETLEPAVVLKKPKTINNRRLESISEIA
jgi:hypothetical protein